MKKHGFAAQNMKPCISHNGCKSVLNDTMGCVFLRTMGLIKEVDPHGI
jgi:hypothetical protein